MSGNVVHIYISDYVSDVDFAEFVFNKSDIGARKEQGEWSAESIEYNVIKLV